MKVGILRTSLVAALMLASAQAQAQYYRHGGPPAIFQDDAPGQYYGAPRGSYRPPAYGYRPQPRDYEYRPQPRAYGYRPQPSYNYGYRQRGVWTVPGQPYGRSPWSDGPNTPNGPFEGVGSSR